jgi:hypothetical protein
MNFVNMHAPPDSGILLFDPWTIKHNSYSQYKKPMLSTAPFFRK